MAQGSRCCVRGDGASIDGKGRGGPEAQRQGPGHSESSGEHGRVVEVPLVD